MTYCYKLISYLEVYYKNGDDELLVLLEKLNMEKKILNKMIENNNGDLSNNFILEQSIIVDKLIIAYNMKKMESYGVYNKFNYRNVGKYEGQRKNGLMEGQGTYYHYASGSKYEGQWENGLQEGIGTFYNSRGLKYIGEWLKGRRKIPYFTKGIMSIFTFNYS